MEVVITQRPEALVVQLNGRFDSSNSQVALREIQQEVAWDQNHVIINASKITYLSSAGLRMLITLYRECNQNNKKLILADLSRRVDEVIKLSGLDALFPIYPTVEEAYSTLKPRREADT